MPMVISELRRQQFLARLDELDRDGRRLIGEICQELGGDQRDRRRKLLAKLELFREGADTALHYDPHNRRESEIEQIHRERDELVMLSVEHDRKRKRVQRSKSDLEMERRERELAEMEAELGAVAES
jgi:hypothetical protein